MGAFLSATPLPGRPALVERNTLNMAGLSAGYVTEPMAVSADEVTLGEFGDDALSAIATKRGNVE